mmetsp:Transcript_12632/g.27297  ORF Transcript_12632/g.27297 Transcript_12632/m.27297 type:complete len:1089 (+) Transcript_12632:75-3341(+)
MAEPRAQLILKYLVASLDANQEVRDGAEAHLMNEAKTEGFGTLLCQIATTQSLQFGVRQLAALLLKKYIKEHWTEDSRYYEPPETTAQEKAAIRQALPPGLADPSSKVRTAVGMAIAAIAKVDWPQSWPGLIEWLIQAITKRHNISLVHGSLRCLSLLSGDLDEGQLPKIVPMLLPELHAIVSSNDYTIDVQREALCILHDIICVLGTLTGAFQRQVRDLIAPELQPWLPTLTRALERTNLGDSTTWAFTLEVLKILVQLVQYFGKFIFHGVPPILAHCWTMFTSGLAVYQAKLVMEEGEVEGEVDVDGEPIDLEALFAQMFELLMGLVSNSRFSAMLRPSCKEMAYITIGYMQMTRSKAESWATDANQYVADEQDEMCTVRVSAELLLDELQQNYGVDGVLAVLEAIERRMAEASQSGWWQLREAALVALGSSEHLLDMAAAAPHAGSPTRTRRSSTGSSGTAILARLHELLQNSLKHDLQAGQANPFLVGRSLWAGAKLSHLLRPDLADAYLQAAVTGVQKGMPPPVRIGACRVIAVLLPRLSSSVKRAGSASAGTPCPSPSAAGGPQSALAALLPGLYEGLMELLNSSSEETLLLVLETLAVVVKADEDTVLQFLPQVLGPVMQIWSVNVADPLVAEETLVVLAALVSKEGCLPAVAQHIMPVLCGVLSAPDQQQPLLVSSSVDVVRCLVRPGSAEVARAVYQAAGPQVMQLLATSDDCHIMQNCTLLLAECIRAGGEGFLEWHPGCDAAGHLQVVLRCADRLLSPLTAEQDCAFVGTLLYEMLGAFLPALSPFFVQVLDAVVNKLVRSNHSCVVTGLLMVLAKLVHVDVNQLINLLDTRTATKPDGTVVRALEAVIPIWLERAGESSGRFRTALEATALTRLLESKHVKLQELMVKGKALDTRTGVRTRSQVAQQGGEQHTRVPAIVKLVVVLAQMLVHAKEKEEESQLFDGGEYDDDEGSGGEEEGGEQGQAAAGLSVQGESISASQQTALDMAMRNAPSPRAPLAVVLGDLEEEQDDADASLANDRGDPLPRRGDPLACLDVEEFLSGMFRRLAAQDRAVLEAAGAEMTSKQARTVQALFAS